MEPQALAPQDRPVVFDYRSVPEFVTAMLQWRRSSNPGFSIRKASAAVGCAPSLVTQVANGKRKLTRDRVDAFASVLDLNKLEADYLDQWIASERMPRKTTSSTDTTLRNKPRRSAPANHLLSDWLNIYVKDACGLKSFKPDPNIIHRLLGGIAPVKRIERSLNFLLREGFLRKSLSGKLVKNDALTTTTDGIPSAKIRHFHRKALEIAARSLELYPVEKRRANALVLSLNEASVPELQALLKTFHEQLMTFAEQHTGENERLFQVLINMTPLGGIHDQ